MRKGLTLVEVITTLLIVIILSAIVLSVISNVKASALKSVAGTNLRSLAQAALIYRDAEGEWPDQAVLEERLAEAACDPRDHRPRGCKEENPAFVGSFLYRPALADLPAAAVATARDESLALAGSPFGEPRLDFSFAENAARVGVIDAMSIGRAERDLACAADRRTCALPPQRLMVWPDGSVRRLPSPNNIFEYFSFFTQTRDSGPD
jgi:type II secretory pathway pseudopilin PulG